MSTQLYSDSEWYFSRAELMLSYYSVLPVPGSLIPSSYCFKEAFKKIDNLVDVLAEMINTKSQFLKAIFNVVHDRSLNAAVNK